MVTFDPTVLPAIFFLGVVGLWRWGFWAVKSLLAWRYDPVDDEPPELDVSVVVPVYEEAPDQFEAAVESWLDNDPHELITVIDASDQRCIDVFERIAGDHPAARLIVTDMPGKRPALKRGVRETTGDVIALVDSDVRWRPNTKLEFLRPFADPDIGGVAPKQYVHDRSALVQRLYEASQRLRFSIEMPALAYATRSLSVVSGRTAVYRREALLDVIEGIDAERFRRDLVISGEDKYITRAVQANGWDLWYQATSVIDIGSKSHWIPFVRQTIRWRRNSARSDLVSLSQKWAYAKPFQAYYMLDRNAASFAILLAPLYFIASVTDGAFFIALLIGLWWLLSRTVKLYPYFREYRGFVMVPVYIGWSFAFAPLQIYALFSCPVQGWLTRGDDERYGLPAVRYRVISTAAAAITGGIVVVFFIGIYRFRSVVIG